MLKERRKCGEAGLENLGEEMIVSGWVNRRRDHGGLIFIDLRDRSGILQVVFDENFNDFETVEKVRLTLPSEHYKMYPQRYT